MFTKSRIPRRWIAVILAVAVLGACQSLQRVQPTDQIDIVMSDEGCSPLDARVEAGSTVTVQIENRSKSSQTIQLLIYPLAVETDRLPAENVYWQARVQPGFSVIEELPVPQMPGDYDLICGQVDSPAHSRGELTVVRP